jgi:FtsP/CotA-like multicopper oxidase with cupredoxin domain
MSQPNTLTLFRRLLPVAAATMASLCAAAVQAATPGISASTLGTPGTPSFSLTAAPGHISQPDGHPIYTWGYGCTNTTGIAYQPSNAPTGTCPTMQLPGPTLIVTQGDVVSVTLTNNLPAAAGNTSILFPGFVVTSAVAATAQPPTCASAAAAISAGPLATEATPGCAVTYTFTASNEGTHTYYSGTQGDLQVEMGLYGAIVVVPRAANVPSVCSATTNNDLAKAANSETDFRLTKAAYSNAGACYDREYLFNFTEMDPKIHAAAEAIANCVAAQGVVCATTMNSVPTEPYVPSYFMVNGRSMPDDMDPNYAPALPNQPYNGNPHMHPGELVLVRVVGGGHWQHPFHEHGNHVRVLARDGNLLVNGAGQLAGPLLFTTTTTPGLTLDGIFFWTGKNLNWDVYGHRPTGAPGVPDTTAVAPCVPDINGYYTSAPAAPNYYEWCGDHNKALEQKPFGDVGSGGPVTLPFPNILTNGAWYGGSSYLGPDATARAVGFNGTTPPAGTFDNSPTNESGFAFMWHSHNEREITTGNIFPGGMMMMMLVDPRAFVIDESK